MKILVVGGAGYIGSHMVKFLNSKGFEVTVFDNLSKGFRDAVVYGKLVEGDLGNRKQLDTLFDANSFDAVMHFASFIEVGESVREPAKYFRNNFVCTQILLDAMLDHGISRFVFSSTAAIFGEPQYTPIDEEHPKNPINPYGRSKLMVEQLLDDYEKAYGMKSISLRYFNASGADPEGELGERHDPETHLIPLVLQAASGRRKSISIFGDDYATADGTCIRDFIQAQDLRQAHTLALEYLQSVDKTNRFNLGNGQGFSVKEVIDCARRVTGRDIEVVVEARRAGDPAVLVADSARAKRELGWNPTMANLEDIIATAWHWEQSFFLK